MSDVPNKLPHTTARHRLVSLPESKTWCTVPTAPRRTLPWTEIKRTAATILLGATLLLQLAPCCGQESHNDTSARELRVGFASSDITPDVEKDSPVWMAGYGWGRKATAVHDRLYARTVVLTDGHVHVAIVAVDLIGLQYPEVQRIRERLPRMDYVLVASTHNHEGPDTIGIWGKTPFHRGVDPAYLDRVVENVVESVVRASQQAEPARAMWGAAEDPDLVGDSRLPVAKDGMLRTLRWVSADPPERNLGLLVQWNSHPETMGPHNTQVTADFCGYTVDWLQKHFECPVVYVSGAIGGLMAPPQDFRNADTGMPYREGEFSFAEAYGIAVGRLAQRAIGNESQATLVPLSCHSMQVAIPLDNPLYRTARLTGVVRRQGTRWTGDFHHLSAPDATTPPSDFAVKTEVACLRLGDVHIAAVPGELYPELVYGKFQEPVDPAADFPSAPLEVPVAKLFSSTRWILFGLANDEIVYLFPTRQWDSQPPYAYGPNRPPYADIHISTFEAAPIVMQALFECVQKVGK